MAVWRTLWLPPSETFVREHIRSLSRWEPILLGLRYDARTALLAPHVAPFPAGRTGRRLAQWSYRLGHPGPLDAALAWYRPELLHAHFGPDAVSVLPLVRRHRLPFIVTFHGYDLTSAPLRPEAEAYRRRLPEVFAQADLLLPVSEFLKEKLLELGAPEEKIRVHYLGVPVPDRLPPLDGPRGGIGYVGRLVPGKGVADLLSAVALLPAQLRAATPVRIVGDGAQRAELEDQAAAIPGARIVFEGRRPAEEIVDIMAGAKVVAAPSGVAANGAAEGYGLVLLEAALAGTPTVAYRYGGVPEAVVEEVTGLLASPGDIPELARLLTDLLEDEPRRRALGEQARRRVVEELDVRRRTALLEDIYDEVVDRHRTCG